MPGLPALRQAVAAHDRRHYGLALDWQTDVLITSGATEALAACLFGLIEAGDEVVLIEPLYDAYLPLVRRAGGVPRVVRLDPPDWRLPADALAAAFSARTKLILVNSPGNPSGRVLDGDELALIARLAIAHDACAVADEVYEHLVFDGRVHRPLLTLPGMAERTLRIGSAGKTFSLTGWKVGWITGPAALIAQAAKAHQFLTFTTPPGLQQAVAHGLDHEQDWIAALGPTHQAKRDRLAAGLAAAGFSVHPSQGSYFLTAGYERLGWNGDDTGFCRFLAAEVGVAAIPMSAFAADPAAAAALSRTVRFCFCKADAVLDAAADRLRRHFG
jgi:aspartate/methionine/tyrosine aminotransferase